MKFREAPLTALLTGGGSQVLRVVATSLAASSGSQAAVGLFRWIGRSPRLINDMV